MRFLDTDIEINSKTIFNLLNPIIPTSPMTTGLLFLAGGIGYYSWNYYKKNKENAIEPIQKEEFDIIENAIEPIQKNDLTKKINVENAIEPIQKEEFDIIENTIEPIEKEEFDMLDDAIEAIQKEEFDMLDDAENEFKTVVNDDNHWALIEMPSNSSNHL